MATSGTYTFTLSRDDIIKAALRVTTAYGVGDAIPAEDINDCAQAFNIMMKEMVVDAIPLWCVQEYAIPTVAGQASYNLSTATGMRRPLKILDVFLRDQTGNDVSLELVSRYDYNKLGQKASQGRANQCYYDPQLGAGNLILYNVPQDSTTTLHVTLQRQIQDINLATENPDFPQEAYNMLKWCLADNIALDYSTPRDVRAEIALKAERYKQNFFASDREQASVAFTPTVRR